MIRDERTREAIKKGLMSGSGKIGIIARVLGDRVVARHGSNAGQSPVFENLFSFSQNFMDDDMEGEEGTFIPTMEDGERHTASLFNGYSRGLHLEIKHDGPEIWVRWQGEIVYHEMAGELAAFCPGDWEEAIEKLSLEARRKEGQYLEATERRNEIVGQRNKDAFLDLMRRRWGLK